jgi:hypothetical protein
LLILSTFLLFFDIAIKPVFHQSGNSKLNNAHQLNCFGLRMAGAENFPTACYNAPYGPAALKEIQHYSEKRSYE